MMAWAVRRRNYLARFIFVSFIFPFLFAPMVARAIAVGRVFHFDFWDFHYRVYWAAVEGAFVDMPIRSQP